MASLLADGFDLDANERLSRAQLEALQIERMKASLAAAYSGNSAYRRAFDEAGVTPDDLRSLADLARFPFTTKADLRAAYPFGFFAVPMERVARRSEEHTSELQSLMRNSYAVFCLKTKHHTSNTIHSTH